MRARRRRRAARGDRQRPHQLGRQARLPGHHARRLGAQAGRGGGRGARRASSGATPRRWPPSKRASSSSTATGAVAAANESATRILGRRLRARAAATRSSPAGVAAQREDGAPFPADALPLAVALARHEATHRRRHRRARRRRQRPVAVGELASARRRRGRRQRRRGVLGVRHHRAQAAARPPGLGGPQRPPHGARQPQRVPDRRAGRHRGRATPTASSHWSCSSSTSTASSWSTTRSATPWATRCCWPWPSACARPCPTSSA